MEIHTGQRIKDVLEENNLNDEKITSLTTFDQSYLSKIYTSRNLKPRFLKNFLYMINRIFDLNISEKNIYHNNMAEM